MGRIKQVVSGSGVSDAWITSWFVFLFALPGLYLLVDINHGVLVGTTAPLLMIGAWLLSNAAFIASNVIHVDREKTRIIASICLAGTVVSGGVALLHVSIVVFVALFASIGSPFPTAAKLAEAIPLAGTLVVLMVISAMPPMLLWRQVNALCTIKQLSWSAVVKGAAVTLAVLTLLQATDLLYLRSIRHKLMASGQDAATAAAWRLAEYPFCFNRCKQLICATSESATVRHAFYERADPTHAAYACDELSD